jgi:hypothetical protein
LPAQFWQVLHDTSLASGLSAIELGREIPLK